MVCLVTEGNYVFNIKKENQDQQGNEFKKLSWRILNDGGCTQFYEDMVLLYLTRVCTSCCQWYDTSFPVYTNIQYKACQTMLANIK